MRKTTENVLKSTEVEIEGRLCLDAQPPATGPTPQNSQQRGQPQVQIVENQAGFAVLEVTCSCGVKSYIKCEYQDTRVQQAES